MCFKIKMMICRQFGDFFKVIRLIYLSIHVFANSTVFETLTVADILCEIQNTDVNKTQTLPQSD